jgi:transposase
MPRAIQKSRRHIKKLFEYIQADFDIWSIDEVLFMQQGSRCRMWIPPEVKNPIVLQQPGRESVGYFGAVRLRDGKFVYAREMDKFNAVTTWNFLKEIHAVAITSGKRAVVIIDNARYHHAKMHEAWRNEKDFTFHLEFLPPYSPELNPIERVWKLTRRRALHNKFFPTLESLHSTAERVFDTWKEESEDLRRLCKI